MISSQNMIDQSYRDLKEVILDLLETQSPKLNLLENVDYPLLILETRDDSIGFAVVNGTPQAAYDSAFRTFKNLYRENFSDWKGRNISFVVCRSEPKHSDDAFFSSIESDIYFCRKYVVLLSSDRESLERELLRLPFTPLPEAFERVIEIPPSAQTLLQRIGVSAPIADKIVNPGMCSAERLVDELIVGVEQLPSLKTTFIFDHYKQAETKNIARIKNLSIEAFRAYKKRQEFDLGADVIVLYGPNGLGKTSFFDAIDYACTGRIGRFSQGRNNQKEFMKLARHLDASDKEGLVSMQINKKGDDFLISRNIADWSYAQIDKDRVDRASLIQFLTSAEWSSKKPRVDKLEALFRATHLFSQTDPELLSTFDQNSTLSNEIVSRMLALDDYSAALKKVSEAKIELEKKHKQNQSELLSLNTEENEVIQRIESIPGSQDPVKAGGQLKNMAFEIAEILRSKINVTIDTAVLNPISVREWRSLVEAELKNANESLDDLNGIERDFNSYSKNISELELTTTELEKAEDRHKKHTAVLEKNQQSLKKLTSSFKRNQNILRRSNLKLLSLSEFVDHQNATQTANNSIKKFRKEMVNLAKDREATNSDLQQHISELDNLQTKTAEISDEYQAISDIVQVLTQIQEGFPAWNKEKKIITKLEQSRKDIILAVETNDTKIHDLKDVINKLENELIKCEKDLDNWSENELALTQLLDDIEKHIHNGNCPTCGTKHTSKKALLKKINLQKQVRPSHVESRIKRRTELQIILSNELESLDTQTIVLNEKKQELEEIESKLQIVRKSVDVFETTIRSAELNANKQLPKEVSQKITDELVSQSSFEEALNLLEAETTTFKRQISNLKRKQTRQNNKRKHLNSEIKLLDEQISAISSTLEEKGLTLGMSPNEIVGQTKKAQLGKERASDRIDDLTPQVDASNQSVEDLMIENGELKEKIENLRQNWTRLNEEVERYQKRAAVEIGRIEIALDVIQKKNKTVVERVDCLDDLRKRTLTLERSLDSSQRSAMLAELKADTLSIEKEKRKLDESDERVEVVNNWLSIVESALFKQNSNAVTNYVDAFGPLTSLIQKRLRAVYGFEDIVLNARGDEIQIKVIRKDELLKPTKYFSDSQKQILMLSIFLAGRITQTWSGFAPILMDDPVTHFDDLNAFGFIEFMRGVINTSPGERQFVISTCEERLFDLMVKKFKSATGGAIFYKFSGIGPNGPTIKKVAN
jgi:exonuclease SbcC